MFEPEETTIEEEMEGVEWPGAEGFDFGEETVQSVIYNKDIGRLLVNVESERFDFDQYVFSATDSPSGVEVDGSSAVGVPPLSENEDHAFWELFDQLKRLEVN